jgi:hypothetical protein
MVTTDTSGGGKANPGAPFPHEATASADTRDIAARDRDGSF